MSNGNYLVPKALNEPIKDYLPGSPERKELQATYDALYNQIIEIPQYIGNEQVKTGTKKEISPPHDHQKVVGYWYQGDSTDVQKAIDAALAARAKWSNFSWQERAAVFLKAADLIAGPYRAQINAATMINQSKNVYQAEIDSACEMIDFLRFNVEFMTQIYKDQPLSSSSIWNRTEYRPLEGFVFAVTPFNFTAISGNLPSCMALMGNVVVWKPSDKQLYSANVLMKVFKEAGLPDGVINMILTDPAQTAEIVFKHPDFSGVHFTGSTHVFKKMWANIGANMNLYKTYPRIVGETGGKDFVWMHPKADALAVATALARGAFEYQGQKCSAASRAYVPKSRWLEVKKHLLDITAQMKIGSPRDFTNFINAVIDRFSFDKIVGYIEHARSSQEAEIIFGGTYDDAKGYFITPTIIETKNPHYQSMEEEIFGPVLTLYIYEDSDWKASLDLVNSTSSYALTGSIFAKDRYIIDYASRKLQDAAGNFYINDKPTGAVVGQQPFGGARASGTNDKAGSAMNLLRWVSARTIKEAFVSPLDFKYPFLQQD